MKWRVFGKLDSQSFSANTGSTYAKKEGRSMRRVIPLFCIVLIIILLSACTGQPKMGKEESLEKFNKLTEDNIDEPAIPQDSTIMNAEGDLYSLLPANIILYFYDELTNQLSPETRPLAKQIDNDLAKYIIKELIGGPETSGLSPVISPTTKVIKVEQTENILTINLSSEFFDSGDLVIARAALVNSLLGLENIKYVKLYVDSKELTENGEDNGVILGLLTRYPNSIPDIIANEAKVTENANIRKINRELYFQDNQGTFLLPEVRTITVTDKRYAEAIVNELLKGPFLTNEGFYSTLPKGTKLNKSEVIKGKNKDEDGIALYFSKEFRTQFIGDSSQEISTLGSLVYSLTTLPNTSFIKIYYENESGKYIDEPIHSIALDQGLTIKQFPDMMGKRIRVFFGDQQGMLLIPEYRAISRDKKNIAERIIAELATNPINPDSVRVIPQTIKAKDIKVKIDGETAIIDVPAVYYENTSDNASIIRDLYAIVNTLTDPINLCNVVQVQFTVEGKTVDIYKGISLKDPFVSNPALIKE